VHKRTTLREARCNDVEEASQRERRRERENGEGGVHAFTIGGTGADR
jgi:hypothetical protein